MVKRYATKQDFTHEYMMSGDPDGRYVDFADYDALAARLAEAEHLILRMAGEDYQRARFYVEKYDLTGERAAVSASVCVGCDVTHGPICSAFKAAEGAENYCGQCGHNVDCHQGNPHA